MCGCPFNAMKKWIGLVLLGVVGVSISGPMVKGALSGGATPVSIAFLRMLLSGGILLPFAIKSGGLKSVLRASGREMLCCIFAGALLAAHYLAWMTSLSRTSTFASVALVCTQPLFVAGLSGVLLHEPMKREAIPGAMIAVLGAIGIGAVSLSGAGGGDFLGDLLALAGALFMAGHWLCGRAARRNINALGYMTFVYLVTAFFLLCAMPFCGGFVAPLPSLGWILMLVFACTLGGHALFTYTLGYVSADIVSFALLGEPIGAALWALLLFGEQISLPLMVGGGVILLGLVLYTAGEIRAQRNA